MLIALVLWAAAAIGFLVWRLAQKRWLTSTVVTVGVAVRLAAVFAYGSPRYRLDPSSCNRPMG